MSDKPDYTGWQDWMRRRRRENVHFIMDTPTGRGVGRTNMAVRLAARVHDSRDDDQ